MSEYFVMLNMPNKDTPPQAMLNVDEEIAYFDSYEIAFEIASEHFLAIKAGFEIFRLGNGER